LGKKLMAKNMARYYQAWELRQQCKKFREIGKIMYTHLTPVCNL